MRRTSIGYKLDYDGEVLPPNQYPDRGEHFYKLIRGQRVPPLLGIFRDA